MAKHYAQLLLLFILLISAVGCYCVFSKQVPDEEGLSKMKMISRNLKGNVFSTNDVPDNGSSDNESNDGSEISDDNTTLNGDISDPETLNGSEISDDNTTLNGDISDPESLNETEEDRWWDTYNLIDELTAACETIECTHENDDRCNVPNPNQPICSPCDVPNGKCTYVPPSTVPPRPTATTEGETQPE